MFHIVNQQSLKTNRGEMSIPISTLNRNKSEAGEGNENVHTLHFYSVQCLKSWLEQ